MTIEKYESCPLCEAPYATQGEYDFQVCNNCDPVPTIEQIESDDYSTAQVAAMAKRIAELQAQLSALEAQREWVSKSDAVAFEYQHEETGQIGYVDQWQVDNGFFENNPRLQLIGPLYRHPPAPEVN